MWHTSLNKYYFKLGILLLLCVQQNYGQDFAYDGSLGPNHWGEKYSTCVGKHQSPIDISEGNINLVKLDQLNFENFDEIPTQATLTNNGHTVMYKIDHDVVPELSGGPLTGVYRFEQLHFHWGENDNEGSETTINNNSFPMELHMVFYKRDYKNMQEAIKHPDGLTVLAFLYEITGKNNTHYDGILHVLPYVQEANTTVNIPKPTTFNEILMVDRQKYFTYDGSLTTPPCSEVVTWIEFKKPIGLSHDQVELFRNLKSEEGIQMTHNFRPTQPLYDRIIYYNSDDEIYDIDNSIDQNDLNVESVGLKSHSNKIIHYSPVSILTIILLCIYHSA